MTLPATRVLREERRERFAVIGQEVAEVPVDKSDRGLRLSRRGPLGGIDVISAINTPGEAFQSVHSALDRSRAGNRIAAGRATLLRGASAVALAACLLLCVSQHAAAQISSTPFVYPSINTPNDETVNDVVSVGTNNGTSDGTAALTVEGGSTLRIEGSDGTGQPFGINIGGTEVGGRQEREASRSPDRDRFWTCRPTAHSSICRALGDRLAPTQTCGNRLSESPIFH